MTRDGVTRFTPGGLQPGASVSCNKASAIVVALAAAAATTSMGIIFI
jgi:hypothetical protein